MNSDTVMALFHHFILLLRSPFQQGVFEFALKFIPYVVLFELPIYFLILMGIVRYCIRLDLHIEEHRAYYPKVSCIVTCYAEGKDAQMTVKSMVEQIYPGLIEIIVVVDGAHQNFSTYQVVADLKTYVSGYSNRLMTLLPKWQRGGRVSSLNAGLQMAQGDIIMALDGDTSFDNDMVRKATRHFENPNIVGVAGNLRVRNTFINLITRLQSLEYLLSIHASKVGLAEFNVVNNISGAFGIFRKSFLKTIGGWGSGTAEDLDLTLRMKNYFGRHPHMRIAFEPKAIGHTDAPDTWRGFLSQRLRWDGDLYYLYIRKHSRSFNPRLLGWRNLIMQVWTGLFFQLVMPFIIIFYSAYVFYYHDLAAVLAIQMMVYLFYFVITTVFYVTFILTISERKGQDLRLAWLLPFIPMFTFILRIWNAVATLKEMVTKAHLDSTMAPWWVLKKSKF